MNATYKSPINSAHRLVTSRSLHYDLPLEPRKSFKQQT